MLDVCFSNALRQAEQDIGPKEKTSKMSFSDRQPSPALQYQVPAALRASSAGFQLSRNDDDDDSEPEYSFDGKCLTPQRLDRYGRLPAAVAKRKVLEEPNGIELADEANETEASRSFQQSAPLPTVPKIKAYRPKTNESTRRMRSWEALEAVRRAHEEETGQPPRFVVDENSGFMLPRDQVVDEGPVDASARRSVVHYKRSLDVVQELREERMLRFFQQN